MKLGMDLMSAPRFLVAVVGILAALVAPTASYARGERDLPSEDKPTTDLGSAGSPPDEWYSLHYQFTGATQYHPSFSAKYSGQNSLSPDAESATAFVTTLYADLRIWPGGELLFNPEMSGGRGLSSTLGVAAFPDRGE